jgi:hypothetical protein
MENSDRSLVIARYCSDNNESPSAFEDGHLRCESVMDWIEFYAESENIAGCVMKYVKFHRIIMDSCPSMSVFVLMGKETADAYSLDEWADMVGESEYNLLKRVCKAPKAYDAWVVYE